MIKINKSMRSEYFKRLLIVYTILVGLFIGVYGFAFSNFTKTNAAATWNGGTYTNLCGDDDASGYNEHGGCFADCNTSSGSCSGTYVYRYTCDGYQTQCTNNQEGPAGSFGFDATCGKTQQIDVFSSPDHQGLIGFMVWYAGDCGEGECTGDNCEPEEDKAVCGESCNEDSDCVNANAQGGDVECRNGMCQLDESVCPDGQTQAGAACECNFEGRTCGQRCGGSYGQCSDGFRCVYADGPVCNFNEVMYCVPQDGDLPTNYNITSCEDESGTDEWGQYVENTQTGKVSYTADELAALCESTPTNAKCNEFCGESADGKECAGGLACTETQTGEFKCRRASNPSSNTCEKPEPGLCNERCGASANGRTCSDGLTCTTTASGVNKCRLASNPTSNLCQQEPGVCNDLCGASANGRTCSGNYTCTQTAGGANRCRRASNPTSNTCAQLPGPCNALCGASANGRTCQDGYTCTQLASGSNRCRLNANPTSTTCQEEETHLACVNQACTEVSGAGQNACSTDDDCEPDEEEKTCYKCTASLTDGNTCESTIVDADEACPTGWTTNSACQNNQTNNVCPSQQDTNPDYSLLKVAENDDDGDKIFSVGDNIHFTVTIRNTGDVNITEMTFVDNYDQVRLGLINNQIVGTATKKNANGQTVSTINNINNIITSSQAGSFRIQDLTVGLGDLQPGQYYEIKLTFFAKAPGVATNYAITQNTTTEDDEELPNKQSQDSVTIINLDTDI